MRILQIIETAYRATLEEQDDPIVWLTHCLRNAGAHLSVLLSGNAVNYALQGQDASGLSFGGWRQTKPPCIESELSALLAEQVSVYAVAEDMERRGLCACPRVAGIELIRRADLVALFEAHDRVWHW